MKRLAFLLALLSGVAACLPLRDNAHDSANVPVGQLALVDTGPGPSCPTEVVGAFDSVVGEISRGRCLALDARASSDPQGLSNIDSYEFALPAALGFAASTTSNGIGFLVLGTAYRRALSTDENVIFGVTVRDDDGNRAEKVEISVDLKNDEPTASIRNGFALPSGGLPWAVGLSMNVVLDGSESSDPDGDPLWYCWTIDDVAAPCVSEADGGAHYSYDAPPEEKRHIVKLQVRDAEESGNAILSRADLDTVWVEPPPLWEVDGSGGANPLTKLDSSTWLPITPTSATGVFHHGDVLGQDLILTVTSVSPTLTAYSYPDFTPGAGTSVGSGGSLFSDRQNNRVWLSRYLGGGNYRFQAYAPRADLGFDDLNGGAGGIDLARPDDPFASAPIAMGPGGELWIASNADPVLHTINAPQAVPSAETLDAAFLDMGARPGRNEMWIMVQTGASAEFRVYAGPGTQPEAVAPPNFYAFGFEWMNEEEMFVTTLDGVLRIDVDLLRDALDAGMEADALTLATIATADALVPTGNLVVDVPLIEIWATGLRISSDLRVVEFTGTNVPLFIDPDGYPWVGIGGLHRARSTSNDLAALSMTFPENASHASVDVARGSAWLLTTAPSTIQEVTHDGRRGLRVPALEMPGGDVELVPAYEFMTVMPDGTGAWAVDQDQSLFNLHRIDFSTSPPTVTESHVFDGDLNGEYVNPYSGFHASGRTSPPFVWTTANDSTDFYPVRVSDAGVFRETGVTISSQFGYTMRIARSLADDAACIATLEDVFITGTTYQLTVNLYRAAPGQPAVLLDQRTFSHTGSTAPGNSHYSLPFVAATRSPTGGEMCWTGHVRTTNPATNQVLTVFGAVQGSGTVRSFTYTGPVGETIESVVANSPNDVWYLRRTSTASSRVHRHSPNGAGVLGSEAVFNVFDHVGENHLLLSVESQAQ